MDDTIKRIWTDGLSPSERPFNRTGEYARVLEDLCDAEQELTSYLEGHRQLFENYSRLQAQLTEMDDAEIFCEAFRLGAQILLGVLGS